MVRGVGDSVESVVGRLLEARALTLAVAESCTGGLVSHRLTNVPGSSAYYVGAVVAYARRVKEALLGVSPETLRQYGAVSEQTAGEMAQGVRRLLGADVGLAVTGIAGPGGGRPGKPVGLVYLALAAEDVTHVERHVWSGDRLANKAQSAERVLEMLWAHLEGAR